MPRPRPARVLARLAAIASIVLVATPALAQDGAYTEVDKRGRRIEKKAEGRAATRANRLLGFVRTWLGTPYLWGGTTRGGIDCSGFLREMFREVYNVELPRTTRDQINLGQDVAVDPRSLGKNFEPGDLFFYVDRLGVPNHVVTYIGDGRFAHSASGRGVVIDRENALWGRRIVGRRVLVPASKQSATSLAIPAYAPIRPTEIPCPPDVRADDVAIRDYWHRPLTAGDLPERFRRLVDPSGRDSPVCANAALKKRLERDLQRFDATSPEAKNLTASVRAVEELMKTLEALDEGLGLLQQE